MSKQYEQTENEPPTARGERGGLGHRDRNADFELESSDCDAKGRARSETLDRKVPSAHNGVRRVPVGPLDVQRCGETREHTDARDTVDRDLARIVRRTPGCIDERTIRTVCKPTEVNAPRVWRAALFAVVTEECAEVGLVARSKVEDRERRKDGASGRRIPVDVVERMRSGRFERIPMTGTPRRVEEARGCAGAATDVDVEERLDGIPP
jgi:hypothetical protein